MMPRKTKATNTTLIGLPFTGVVTVEIVAVGMVVLAVVAMVTVSGEANGET